MKLSQKRTCNSCVALADGRCELGFKIKGVLHKSLPITKYHPLEECYKPLKINDYLEARELVRQ